MDELKKYLPRRLYEIAEKAGINTPRQILTLSESQLLRTHNLSASDITLLKDCCATCCLPNGFSNVYLEKQRHSDTEECCVTSGCPLLDSQMRGGYRRGTITEIAGESGSGKTQLCLQAAARRWQDGAVYISTEDTFPYQRMCQMFGGGDSDNDTLQLGEKIFVEQITEVEDLKSCLRVRLPILLQTKPSISLIVVDSVAAPFRGTYDSLSGVARAQDLKDIAISLLTCAKNFNLAVICVNQVTTSFQSETISKTVPCLGLAWSNMVSTRFVLRKTQTTTSVPWGKLQDENMKVSLRELEVAFAPDLPNKIIPFIVTLNGVRGLNE